MATFQREARGLGSGGTALVKRISGAKQRGFGGTVLAWPLSRAKQGVWGNCTCMANFQSYA